MADVVAHETDNVEKTEVHCAGDAEVCTKKCSEEAAPVSDTGDAPTTTESEQTAGDEAEDGDAELTPSRKRKPEAEVEEDGEEAKKTKTNDTEAESEQNGKDESKVPEVTAKTVEDVKRLAGGEEEEQVPA